MNRIRFFTGGGMKRLRSAAPRLVALIVVVFSLFLAPYAPEPARAAAPRLVVFEGFYNPG